MHRTEVLLGGALGIGIALLVLTATAVEELANLSNSGSSGPNAPGQTLSVTVGVVAWNSTVHVGPGCNATVYQSPDLGFSESAGAQVTIYATIEYPSGRVPACVGTTATANSAVATTPGFAVTGGNLPLSISATTGKDPNFEVIEIVVTMPSYAADVPTLDLNVTGD